MSIENLLPNLSDQDRQNYIDSISTIGTLFESQTGVAVSPEIVASLSQIRDYVLADTELDVEAAIRDLSDHPQMKAALVKAQVRSAELETIKRETANLTPAQKMTYSRKMGLDVSRDDVTDNLTESEKAEILSQLNPSQRISHARNMGWI